MEQTPRNKAYELIHKHHDKIADVGDVIWLNVLHKWMLAKQSALITVDELIEICHFPNENNEAYWNDVKKEIEKL